MDKVREEKEQILKHLEGICWGAMTNFGEYTVENVWEHTTKIARAIILNGYLPVEEVEPRVLAKPCEVICLCGSTRFTTEMLIIQWNFTKQGKVVLTWCALPDNYYQGEDKTHIGDQEGVKEVVDEVHKRKIDLADTVFIVNIGGYIGESTTSEILYALSRGKPIEYLEPEWEYPFTENNQAQIEAIKEQCSGRILREKKNGKV